MNDTLIRLRNWGCDIAGAMERFMDDEDFYMEYLPKIAQEPSFEHLGEAIAAGDVKTAFEAAHSLKGVLGNMGLTPLYSVCCEAVEKLRKGEMAGVPEDYRELMKQRDVLMRLIG